MPGIDWGAELDNDRERQQRLRETRDREDARLAEVMAGDDPIAAMLAIIATRLGRLEQVTGLSSCSCPSVVEVVHRRG